MRNLKDIRKYKFVFFLILVFFSMATSPTGVDMTDPKTPEITNPGVSSTKPKGLEATLNDINNNMGQMAEIMAKMFSTTTQMMRTSSKTSLRHLRRMIPPAVKSMRNLQNWPTNVGRAKNLVQTS